MEDRDCAVIQEMLGDYSVDNLGRTATERVRKHLSQCAICSKEMASLQAATELVEDFGALEPPAGLWNGVYNRLTTQEHPQSRYRSRPRSWLARPLALVAAGLTVIVLVLALAVTQPHPPQMAQVDITADEYFEGHALLAQDQLFADRITLNLVAAAAGDQRAKNAKL